MSTDARSCPVTGEPLRGDRFVSVTACRRLDEAAQGIVALMGALDAAKAGLRRGQGGGASVTPCSRPPVRLGVVQAASVHERTLLKWAKWVAHDLLGIGTPQTWTEVSWAFRGASAHPGRPELATLIPEVLAAIRALTALVDIPEDHRFYGRCLTDLGDAGTCDQPIYAPPGSSWARCPACDTQWELQPLLASHLEAAADWLVTPDEGARLLTQAGYPTRPGTIRLWKHRGHLTDQDGRYHVGDLLAAAARRKDKAA